VSNTSPFENKIKLHYTLRFSVYLRKNTTNWDRKTKWMLYGASLLGESYWIYKYPFSWKCRIP